MEMVQRLRVEVDATSDFSMASAVAWMIEAMGIHAPMPQHVMLLCPHVAVLKESTGINNVGDDELSSHSDQMLAMTLTFRQQKEMKQTGRKHAGTRNVDLKQRKCS